MNWTNGITKILNLPVDMSKSIALCIQLKMNFFAHNGQIYFVDDKGYMSSTPLYIDDFKIGIK